MFRAWDSDRKVLTVLVAAAAISLGVTYKDALADTAHQLAQKVEGALSELKSKLPALSPRLNRTPTRQRAFDPREGHSCDPGCAEAEDGSIWYGTVDCWGHVQGVRRCGSGDGCSR
jgi:hypothetical protein